MLKITVETYFFDFFQQKYGKTGVNWLVNHMKILLSIIIFQTAHIFFQTLLKVKTIFMTFFNNGKTSKLFSWSMKFFKEKEVKSWSKMNIDGHSKCDHAFVIIENSLFLHYITQTKTTQINHTSSLIITFTWGFGVLGYLSETSMVYLAWASFEMEFRWSFACRIIWSKY